MIPRTPLLPAMKAVSGVVPTDGGWAFEVKWDGMRVITAIDGDVRGQSNNGIDVLPRFPELAGLADHLGSHRAVLDGEVVALDDRGRSSFSRLQPRMQATTPARIAETRRHTAVTYVIFDLLHLDGHDTVSLPYEQRRSLLVDLVEPGPHRLVPGHVVDGGSELFAVAAEQGLEGVMAKRTDSTYLPGKRSAAWRKCKVRRRQELVIGGWTSGEGSRTGTLGSLLVGVHRPGARPGDPLLFSGGVGTGFTDAVLRELSDRLTPLATDRCPFGEQPPRQAGRSNHWVEPVLVCEAEFGEWSPDGRLRHPSYLGLRIDRDPLTVVREPDPGSAEPS